VLVVLRPLLTLRQQLLRFGSFVSSLHAGHSGAAAG
jgi:hypothetical protein